MPETTRASRETVDALYRAESRAVLATLIRLLGDFDLAEEALHEAFRAALERWPREGLPGNPRAWLVSAGRYKAIDSLRRSARFEAWDEQRHDRASEHDAESAGSLEDDRLRLVFTCCHPALNADAQVALTLREVCGLATEDIAAAFLVGAPTLAQRIVRAKAKIRDAGIPYEVPQAVQLPERLDSVLRVIYLVFNEGYSAHSGEAAIRHELCAEAIRLGRLLAELLPEPEAVGLLALMLLQDSRRAARVDQEGRIVLLEDQDRTRWDRVRIGEGLRLVEQALATRRGGPYCVQAAIAALHAGAERAADTDWVQIVGLYDVLLRMTPSPVIALNRAVALAMRDGADAGLREVDVLLATGELQYYGLAHAARADLCRRLGRHAEARTAYERALALTQQAAGQAFLRLRLAELP